MRVIIVLIISLAIYGCSNNTDIRMEEYFPMNQSEILKYAGHFSEGKTRRTVVFESKFFGTTFTDSTEAYIRDLIGYIDDERVYEVQTILNYDKDGNVIEFAIKSDNQIIEHLEPHYYLSNKVGWDKYQEVFLSMSSNDSSSCEKCLKITKDFYDGDKLIRKEVLLLRYGVGIIKYREEAFGDSPYTLEYSLME